MKLSAILAAAAVAMTVPAALAQDAGKIELTVEQAVNVASGLNQMVKFDTVGKDGKPAVGYYHFPADVRMAMAVNIDAGRAVQNQLEAALAALKEQASAGSAAIPPEKVAKYNDDARKLLRGKASRTFEAIPRAALDLDKNPIPAPVLSLILPVLR